MQYTLAKRWTRIEFFNAPPWCVRALQRLLLGNSAVSLGWSADRKLPRNRLSEES